jgi:pyruvate/2-oxoglutarate dehydrogenase complex dihydrolipoamide acyltransferase (E2) component
MRAGGIRTDARMAAGRHRNVIKCEHNRVELRRAGQAVRLAAVGPRQIAIPGAGGILSRVILTGGRRVTIHVPPWTLTFYHRRLSGAEAARFLMP